MDDDRLERVRNHAKGLCVSEHEYRQALGSDLIALLGEHARLADAAGVAAGPQATPDQDGEALRSIVRRVADGWTLCIDNLDMVDPYWSNTDADVDLTPAEREALARVVAVPTGDQEQTP